MINKPLSITVLTLFPEMFPGPLAHSLALDAYKKGLWTFNLMALRDFAEDKHRTVDEPCFGGGPGMVLRPDVIHKALQSIDSQEARLIYLSPRGTPLKQHHLRTWSQEKKSLILLCGRYEGVDQRVLDHWKFEEISVGDYIVMGGEIPAMLVIEGCVRLLEGALGNSQSTQEESFTEGLLEYPHYTRPSVWEGKQVPKVLLSGHHENIRRWRQHQAEEITQKRRPDLWTKHHLHDRLATYEPK